MLPTDPDTKIATPAGNTCVFIVRDQKVLIDLKGGGPAIPRADAATPLTLNASDGYHIGTQDGMDCYAFAVPAGTEAPQGMSFKGLRRSFGVLKPEDYAMAIRAMGILNWDRTCRFCSVCGSKVTRLADVLAKQCDVCGFTMFPKISPAVIVAVERGNTLLLARASRFAENLYSVLAGFTEPGESLEDTVRREIREEVGIDVRNIRYFGSQPWPYPDSLMIGFTAEWASGEIVIDDDEINDARWFTVEDMPLIPDKVSIARALIDEFIKKIGERQ
jgi:NAD+ diphosphatase